MNTKAIIFKFLSKPWAHLKLIRMQNFLKSLQKSMSSIANAKSLTLIMIGLYLCACAYSQVNWRGIPKTTYHMLQDDLTRTDKVYGLENVIYDLRIVYFTDDLRKAYIQEYAKMFELNSEDKAAFEKAQLEIQVKFDEFYVANFSSKKGYQNLNERKEEKQIWSISLASSEGDVRPLLIEPIKRTEKMEYFFPIMDGFSKIYKLRFDKIPSPVKKLKMQSPSRTALFDWNTTP